MVIIERTNVLLMGILLNLQEVAIYEVAGKISEGFLRIFRAFIVVYFPNLSKLFATYNREDAKTFLNQTLGFLSAGISFLVFGVFLFRKPIIVLMFSEAYVNAALPLSLMMFNFHLRAMSNILGYSIVSAGQSSIPVRANIVASAVLVVGSLLLIPRFGVIGAIISSFFMNITTQIVYIYFLGKAMLKVNVFDYVKPMMCVVFLCGLYLFVGWDEPALRALFFILYIGLSWLYVHHWQILVKNVLNESFQIIGVRR